MLRASVPLIRRGYQTLQRYPGGPIGFAEDAGRAVGIASRHFGTVTHNIGRVAKGAAVAKAVHDLHTGGLSRGVKRPSTGLVPSSKMRRLRSVSFAPGRRRSRLRSRSRKRVRFASRSSRFSKRRRTSRQCNRLSIPTVGSRNLSGVFRIRAPAIYSRFFIVRLEGPTQFFEFYKEYRLLRAVVSVRRRRPESTVFESASGGQTAAAARQETNDIFWLPFASIDTPTQHPRQIRQARLLSSIWSTAVIRQRCIKTNIVTRPMGNTAVNTNNISGQAAWTSALNAVSGFQVQSWAPMPYVQVDKAVSGGVSSTGFAPFPGNSDLGAFNPDWVWFGFLYVDNSAAMLGDDVEVRAKVYWKFRGRKPLGNTQDITGDLNLGGAQIGDMTIDTRGLTGGMDAQDFTTIHVAGYDGPPDPGDVCFPCGPAPVYGVDPPETST